MTYALIKNGVVVNIIIADEEFISLIESQYDFCVQVDNLDPIPYLYDLYDGTNFSKQVLGE